ncbi:Uncharacterized protein PCOAH_00045330 [Plasmodium coatneyi]|uniref:Uncharacterized protein n=1 Tax=Plasmodium coatneyi TaxID=208452 RepID=A0A1B1E3P2_9APIC|nr:Uncharacterized protein PCOAH_00045330 [Plasmodium coatneyi]ANQ09577.1 Uncharacterized protein PCOAH_00045330 [Plasmodium coatneyi]
MKKRSGKYILLSSCVLSLGIYYYVKTTKYSDYRRRKMKKISSLVREFRGLLKKKNGNRNQSSILSNIKIQNIYANNKINKREHYVYFKEYDIKSNDCSHSRVAKTKRLFSSERSKYKNAILFATIGSTIGIVSFVYFISPQWNDYYY